MLNMFLTLSFIFVLAESNAADGYILWHNCSPGVYLHGRKVICKYLLPSTLNNHFSVSVTFVSDASHSGSGKKFSFLSKTIVTKDSGLPTNWLLAHELTTSPMVVFSALHGPIDYQGTNKIHYQHTSKPLFVTNINRWIIIH